MAASSTRTAPSAPPKGNAPPRAEERPQVGSPRGEVSAPSGAAGRRAGIALAVGAAVVGALCLADALPLLYVVSVATGLLVARRLRRRPAVASLDTVRIAPTPVGFVVLVVVWVLVLLAVFLPSPSFRLLACLLAACAAVGWPLATANVARVAIERRLPPRPVVGVPTVLEVLASNPSRRGATGIRVEDEFGLITRPAAAETSIPRLDAGATARAGIRLVFQRRGLRRLRPVRISSVHPIGVFAATRETASPIEVLVRPRELVPRRALLDRLRGRASEPVRARAVRAGEDEFHGIREHREGDDPRRAHPRTSARRGAPTYVVRREEPARRVVVALARAAIRDRASDVAFEKAVSAAAGLLRACVRQGIPATLLLDRKDGEAGPGVVVVGGAPALGRALDALATVRGDGERAPEEALRGGASPATARDALLVWISSTTDGARAAPGLERGIDPRRRVRLRADDPSFERFVEVRP